MKRLQPLFYGYVVVIASLIIIIASHCLPFSFGVFFKPMISELDWSRAATSGAFSLSRIVSGIFSIFIGGLNDKIGPRLIVSFCGISILAGCLLLSSVNTLAEFYLVYGIVMAIGPSVFVAIASTIARWFVKRRSIMTGIVAAGLGVSTLISVPIADYLVTNYGWRSTYIFMGVVITVIVLIFAQLLKKDPMKMGLKPYDTEKDAITEQKAPKYAFPLRAAIRTRQFWLFFSYSACFAFCIMTIMVHSVPFITDSGISSSMAANILATAGAVTIVSMIGMGRLADRLGNRKTQIIGFVLLSIALIILILAEELWEYYLFALLFGTAWGGVGVPRSPLVAEMFGIKSHGLIFGAVDNSYTIGGAIGPVVTGYIYDISGNYHGAFVLALVVSVTGLLLTIILNPKIKREIPELLTQ